MVLLAVALGPDAVWSKGSSTSRRWLRRWPPPSSPWWRRRWWGLDEEWAWARWTGGRAQQWRCDWRGRRRSAVVAAPLGADDLRSNRLAEIDVAAARLGVRLVVPGCRVPAAFVLTTIVPVVLALARQVLAS